MDQGRPNVHVGYFPLSTHPPSLEGKLEEPRGGIGSRRMNTCEGERQDFPCRTMETFDPATPPAPDPPLLMVVCFSLQRRHDPDGGAIPVPAPHLGPVRSPAAPGTQPLTPATLHQPRCQLPCRPGSGEVGCGIWGTPLRGSGKGCPINEHLESQEAASARMRGQAPGVPTGHSSASSCGPRWILEEPPTL